MVRKIEDADEKEQLCREVLTSLPDWFGNPDSVEGYATHSRELPMWADIEDGCRGFIVFRPTSPYAGEIYVMGVRKECHRKGLGRGLFEALRAYAKEQGIEFLTVKTVEMGHYEDYDQTNRFYQSLGFKELECFRTLWDEANPCQVYIMGI